MQKIITLIVFTVITQTLLAQTSIPIDSVGAHIGENVTVCSRVYGIKTTDKVTFINMGAPYPNSPLTVVVFAKDLPNFKEGLDWVITDKQVCVTGTLKIYKGTTEIVVSKPEELKLQ